ncbi:hypothetical protein WJX77_001377 [Trebouxia sp. C0004]
MTRAGATHFPSMSCSCHRQAPAANLEAPCMFNTQCADLGLPFDQLLKQEETVHTGLQICSSIDDANRTWV